MVVQCNITSARQNIFYYSKLKAIHLQISHCRTLKRVKHTGLPHGDKKPSCTHAYMHYVYLHTLIDSLLTVKNSSGELPSRQSITRQDPQPRLINPPLISDHHTPRFLPAPIRTPGGPCQSNTRVWSQGFHGVAFHI